MSEQRRVYLDGDDISDWWVLQKADGGDWISVLAKNSDPQRHLVLTNSGRRIWDDGKPFGYDTRPRTSDPLSPL